MFCLVFLLFPGLLRSTSEDWTFWYVENGMVSCYKYTKLFFKSCGKGMKRCKRDNRKKSVKMFDKAFRDSNH